MKYVVAVSYRDLELTRSITTPNNATKKPQLTQRVLLERLMNLLLQWGRLKDNEMSSFFRIDMK